MVLNKEEIQELIKTKNLIKDYKPENVQPASYDLTNDYYSLVLKPGEFKLITTDEWINMPNDVGAFLKTKSSLARIGVVAGDIGGWIDPGYHGNITIAVYNLSDSTVTIGENTTQIVFLSTKETEGYNGHYQNGKVESIFPKWTTTKIQLKEKNHE